METVQIVNRRVHRVLIDNGSSVNILYKATLEKIGLTVRDLKACATTLYGFSGEGIASIEAVDLTVTLGEYPILVTKIVEFVVVDTPSAYNVILGRPILISLGAASSVRHHTLKFPTPRGVGTIKGD